MHRAHSKAKTKSKKSRGVLHAPKEEQKIIKQEGHKIHCAPTKKLKGTVWMPSYANDYSLFTND